MRRCGPIYAAPASISKSKHSTPRIDLAVGAIMADAAGSTVEASPQLWVFNE